MPNDLANGACTIFNSAMHENRPVVFAGTTSENKAQLLDYTIGNTWEESKHEFRFIIKTTLGCKMFAQGMVCMV